MKYVQGVLVQEMNEDQSESSLRLRLCRQPFFTLLKNEKGNRGKKTQNTRQGSAVCPGLVGCMVTFTVAADGAKASHGKPEVPSHSPLAHRSCA